ncbi:hypothetical protein KQI84_02555 [bacterium]|nr:hypothetical protein [bacterium]
MRKFALLFTILVGLAFVAPPVSAGDWGISVSSPGIGAYYSSRDRDHHRPHSSHWNRSPRHHWRPVYYRPTVRHYYPRYRSCYPSYSRVRIGLGYWGSHGSIGISTTFPHDYFWYNRSRVTPTYYAEDYPLQTRQIDEGDYYDSQYRAPRGRTVYEHQSNQDDRTIQQRAVYKGDKLLRSETYVDDRRPSGDELQPGTNYTRDGRLRYRPEQPQQQEEKEQEKAAETEAQQTSTVSPRATIPTRTVAVPSYFRNRMVNVQVPQGQQESKSTSRIQAVRFGQNPREEMNSPQMRVIPAIQPAGVGSRSVRTIEF